MPPGRDPVRRYFQPIDKGGCKVDRVQCRYCKKALSTANPLRLKAHLSVCNDYKQRSRSPSPEDPSTLPPLNKRTWKKKSEMEEPLPPPMHKHTPFYKSVPTRMPSSATILDSVFSQPQVMPSPDPPHALPGSEPPLAQPIPDMPRTQPVPEPSRAQTVTVNVPVYSPRYEKVVLEANAIFIQQHGYVLPDELVSINRKVLTRARASPELHKTEAQQFSFCMANSSASWRTNDIAKVLFPHDLADNCMRVERQPFCESSLPQGLPWDTSAHGPSVVTPIPDLTFGYKEEEDLLRTQSQVFKGVDLVGICSPIPGLYRPFLIAHLLSDATPLLSARNHAAGAGAACVYTARTMSMLAPGVQYNRRMSMAYSCTVVGFIAVLWIHWMEPRRSIHMAPVETYNLCKGDDLANLRRHVRNILEWGLTDRAHMQREHLKAIQAAMRRAAQPFV